ncbi:phototemtide A non-ribosomal peptide synthetase PttB [Photorhabdus sp. RM323S]|uniref:phototemtide A non-ribosomal peptide synthetase PttB n=1 Tax=Photorhabdus sp. RM323S TaxID=3342828 RepID=UPI0036D7A665
MNKDGYCNLTSAQFGIWSFNEIIENKSINNISEYFIIDGDINFEYFSESVRKTVEEAEALHSRFYKFDNCIKQKFFSINNYEPKIIDYSDFREEIALQKAKKFLMTRTEQYFDICEKLPFEISLIKIAENKFLYFHCYHHIVMDGLGASLIIQRIISLYNASFIDGSPPPSPFGKFKELIDGDIDYHNSSRFICDRDYWLNLFADIPTPASLANRIAPPLRTIIRHRVSLGYELTDLLHAKSKEMNCTLPNLLIAITCVYLHRMTGLSEVIVGLPVTGRLGRKERIIPGLMANILPMRLILSPDLNLKTVLARAARQIMTVLRHQKYRYEDLCRDLKIINSGESLYRISINVESFDNGGYFHQSKILPCNIANGPVSDLNIFFFDYNKEVPLTLGFDANSELYSPEQLSEHTSRMLKVFYDLLTNQDATIGSLLLLNDNEYRNLEIINNKTLASIPSLTLADHFEDQVKKSPDKSALYCGDISLTYAQLNEKSNKLGHYLLSQHFLPNDTVALLLPRTVDLIVALLAISKIGATYIPLDPDYPEERLKYIIETAKPKIVLTSINVNFNFCLDALRIQLDDVNISLLVNSQSIHNPIRVVTTANQAAYILFTSGSTGNPKGVVITHHSLTNFLYAMQMSLQIKPSNRILAVTTIGFDIAGLEIFLPLVNGASIALASHDTTRDPNLLASEIVRNNITHLQGTPALWQGLVEYQPNSLSNLTAIVGGDSLPKNLAERMVSLAHRVIQVYGPTETTIWSTLHELTVKSVQPNSIGLPILNTQIYILDTALQPVPVGYPGELYIAGDGLALGYLDLPAMTSERFVANPFGTAGQRMYRTGDLACWGSDMNVNFLGRVDNQVKIRGYRIELGEIENTFLKSPLIKSALVIAYGKESISNKYLVAYVVLRKPNSCSSEELNKWLRKHLPDYMLPAVIMIVDSFPLMPNGKIDRHALLAPIFKSGERVLPESSQEKILCKIFEEVLGFESIGINDSFFKLGGNSLLAIQLLIRLRIQLNIELPLKAIFESPTVKELSKVIADTDKQYSLREKLTPQPRPNILPMSFAQQRLWLQGQINESSAYNMPMALRIYGELDTIALSAALSDVVKRHESLRTYLTLQDDIPCQYIVSMEEISFSLHVHELDESQITKELTQQAGYIFRLDKELPIKAWLYRIKPEQHIFLLLIHHTAGDGGSISPLLHDLSHYYQAHLKGENSSLPPLPVQYADYTLWQHILLSDEQKSVGLYAEQMHYWCNQLALLPEEVTIASVQPRPTKPSSKGDCYKFSVPPDIYQGLKRLALQAEASLFMVLKTALAVLLHRMGAGDDISVGTPVLGRTDEAQMPLIGLFSNTLVLRTNLSDNPDFVSLIAQVRKTVLDAYMHQDLPFEQIVEFLTPHRSASKHPLFQVMMVLEEEFSLGNIFLPLRIEQQELLTKTAKFDLLFVFKEDAQQGLLKGHIEFATDLYDTQTVAGFVDRLFSVLNIMANRPTEKISEICLLNPFERQQLLKTWNNTLVELPNLSLGVLFEQQAARSPNAIAVSEGSKTLTYAQLNIAANRLAHRLRELTGAETFCVGLLMAHSIDQVIATLAVIKAGAAYLPLRVSDPLERQQMMLDDAGAAVLITDVDHHLPTARFVICNVADSAGKRWPKINPATNAGPSSLAYIMYTSGSTGKPKGIAVNQESVIALACDRRWLPEDHQRVLLHSPAAFDASTYEFWVPLLCGGQLVVAPKGELDIDVLAQTIANEKITALWLTVGLFRLMAEDHASSLTSVRLLLAGGDVLPKSAIETVMRHCPGLVIMNGYGPTETTTFATTYAMHSVPGSASVPIGMPLDNMQVYVLDTYLQPVPVGVSGELYIAGTGLARGYLNQPSLTASHFIANPFGSSGDRMYRSGDWVRWRQEGVLEYLNRGDQQVKIRGFRIELAEIEAALLEWEGVAQALVCIFEPQKGNKQLAAYVIAEKTGQCEPTLLRQMLSARLPDFMVPAVVSVVERFPLTTNGKVDMRVLPVPEFNVDHARTARNEQESKLCHLFAEVLGLSQVGIDDNFFDLGGHSLLASRFISHVRKALKVNLSIRDLFEAPTVAQFVQRLGQGSTLRPALQVKPRPERLPLSAAQSRLWMVDRIEGGKSLYNMPLTLELQGELSVPAMAAALNDVVARHESLRTRLQELSDGNVYQQIAYGEDAQCELTLHHVLAENLDEEVLAASEYIFDLANENPCRALLFHVEPNHHVLLFLMHHIASDGASLVPLLRDLALAYHARLQGQAPNWAPLQVQYADYTLWQHELLGDPRDTGSLQSHQLAYWSEVLHGLPEELQLPTDRPRPQSSSYQGGQWCFEVDPEVYARLLELARQQNASLFMVLQAALAVLLSRLGAGLDIPLGVAIAGRTDEALEPLIGFFTNTLVLRTDVSGNPTFDQLLARVRDSALQAYEHQDLPFENLVETLNPERSLARHPLFQVMLVLQNNACGEVHFDGLNTRVSTPLLPVAKFDLTFNFEETPTSLNGIFEYATDLFDGETAERLAGYFANLLAAISCNTCCNINELELFSARERQQIVNEWNNTTRQLPAKTFAEQFEAFAKATPDAPALLGESERLTYSQLDQRANRLANLMMERGIGTENIIAIALPHSVDLIIALIATLKTGAAYLPLDPDYPQERLNYMLEHSQPALVITDSAFVQRLGAQYSSLQIDQPALHTQLAQQQAESITLPRKLSIDNAAYIIYTSGSTGLPKGVLVTHRGISNLVASMVERLHVTQQSRVLQFASPSFDASFWDINMGLLSGAALVVAGRDALSPGEPLYELMLAQGVTHATLPPVGLAVMPRNPLPALETLVVAGEACQPELIDYWGQGRRMINAYGPSESTVCATMSQPLVARKAPPIGTPIVNMQVYVLDERLQPVAPGVKGELYIAGESLARGYVRRPDLTAERFVANPFGVAGSRMYRTGDVAYWQANGELMFAGRVDHQVKIRGFRIELGEIESLLLRHPQLSQATVIVREDKPGLRQLVAYVVVNEGDVNTAELREYLRIHLPEYMVPVAIVMLPAIPVTPNGKVDRRALPQPDFYQPHHRGPRNTQEQLLCTLFADLLGVEQVDIDGSFFEMGGDSITAIQLVARARQAGWIFTPRQVFEHKTVASLARKMQANITTVAETRVSAVGELPVTPIIHWLMENPGNINGFSQATLLQTPEHLDEKQLRQMLTLLLEQHDALRLVANRATSGDVLLTIPPMMADIVDGALSIVDCQAFTLAELQRCIKAESQRAKQRLDPAAGKMLQAVWFRASAGQPGRLMLVLHHLVVDGVSWRILAPDLQNIWAAMSAGKTPELLPVGTSFRAWAYQLQQEANARRNELNYWLTVLAKPDTLLTSRPLDGTQDTVAASDSLRLELPAAFTQPLLGTIPALFHAGINDVLLCAFALAVNDWRQTSQTDVLLDLEGHGREELPGTELSRTVGWFTNMYPVRLEPGATQQADPYSLGHALKRIKEQLRQVPANGLGYGLLRYLNPQTQQVLSQQQQAQIGFNYLGRMAVGGDRDWQVAAEANLLDTTADNNFALPHALSLNALVEERSEGPVLVSNWSWARALHTEERISVLGNHWFRWLKAMSQLSTVPDAGGFTPSDITMLSLKQNSLEKLQAKWKKKK